MTISRSMTASSASGHEILQQTISVSVVLSMQLAMTPLVNSFGWVLDRLTLPLEIFDAGISMRPGTCACHQTTEYVSMAAIVVCWTTWLAFDSSRFIVSTSAFNSEPVLFQDSVVGLILSMPYHLRYLSSQIFKPWVEFANHSVIESRILVHAIKY
jgi:hypothetical protein